MKRTLKNLGFLLAFLALAGLEAHAFEAHLHGADQSRTACVLCHTPEAPAQTGPALLAPVLLFEKISQHFAAAPSFSFHKAALSRGPPHA